MEEASTASELEREKFPIASVRPLSAIPPCWNAKFRVSFDCEIQAICDAENASKECITKGKVAARLRNLDLSVVVQSRGVELESW